MKKIIQDSTILKIVIITIVLITTGCEKDEITNVNGSWSGRTSQNESITFTVSANSVTVANIKVVTPGFTITTMTSWPSGSSITDNKFSLRMSGQNTVYINGEFTSNNSSKGSFTLGTTKGTWTASKQ